MSENYSIDNAKKDIENLQDQNSYDFQEIKRLDGLIKDYDKRVTQAINLNNQINKKIEYDYEKFKKSVIEDILDIGNGGGGITPEQVAQIEANSAAIGTEELPTIAKTLKGAIAETFQSVSNGKTLIASAITDKGITTSNTDTFQTMANNISLISGGSSSTANYQLKSKACLDYLKYLHEQRVSDYIENNGLFINGVEKSKEEISDWILNRDNFKYRGKLKKNGKFITDKDNCKFEIRGVGLHHILQYTNLHNKLNFETLKYYGVNCIRLSIYLEDYTFASSDNQLSYGYISHPTESKAKIEELVNYCTELNLYVIIDWHVMAYGTNGQVPEEPLHTTEALEFFQYFSNLYANQDNVLYELANEPFTTSAADLVTFITPLRDAIKQNVVDPILISGVSRGGVAVLYNTLISNGIDDVFISEHTYSKLTSSDYQTYLNSDIPLFTTEWGNSASTGDGAGNDSIATKLLDWYHSSSVPHCIWKFTDQTMTTSMLKNKGTINNIYYKYGGFLPSDLSENGQLYFDKFSYYAFDNYISRPPISTDCYSVIYNLDDNITSSNSVTSVCKNSPYETTLTIAEGYKLSSLIVLMDGENISSTAVSGNAISISFVTGDLNISASSVLDTSDYPTITSEYNIFDLSSTAEANTVLNSSGVKVSSNKSVSSTQKIMVTGGTTINVYTNSDNIKDMICCEYDSNGNLVSRSPFLNTNNFSLTTASSTRYILLACNCLSSISVNDTEAQTKVFSTISCSISSFNYVDVSSYKTNYLAIDESGNILSSSKSTASSTSGYLNIPVEQNKIYYLAAPFLHDRFRIAFTSSPANGESTQGELLYNNSLSNGCEFTATSNGYITVALTVTSQDINHLKMFTK